MDALEIVQFLFLILQEFSTESFSGVMAKHAQMRWHTTCKPQHKKKANVNALFLDPGKVAFGVPDEAVQGKTFQSTVHATMPCSQSDTLTMTVIPTFWSAFKRDT